MSAKVMGMVFDAGPEAATERFVLLAIADNCDDGGYAYPGVELLARKVCQTETNVLRVLKALEVGGWLTIKRRSWGERKRFSSYQLNMARLRKSAAKVVEVAAESAVEAVLDAVATPSDKLLPDETQVDDSIEPNEGRHDKLLPDAPPLETGIRGDKTGIHEVTFSPSRGDIGAVPFNVFNRQEPSTEPKATPQPPASQGECFVKNGKADCEDCDVVDGKRRCTMNCGPCVPRDSVEDGAKHAVRHVKRECGWSDKRLDAVIEQALRAHSEKTGICLGDSAVVMAQSWKAYLGNKHLMRFPVNERKFIQRGWWLDDRAWPWDRTELRKNANAQIGMDGASVSDPEVKPTDPIDAGNVLWMYQGSKQHSPEYWEHAPRWVREELGEDSTNTAWRQKQA